MSTSVLSADTPAPGTDPDHTQRVDRADTEPAVLALNQISKIYLTGTEGMMGQVLRDAMDAGLPYQSIQTEHRGSTVRRVQCVHCKGVTENVRTDPFQCSHCGLHLFVRDHYSRRIAAFQGVNIDAEDPGEVPPAVERFK